MVAKQIIDGVDRISGILNDLADVTITGTPADNEVLAYDTGTGEWMNQTSTELGLDDLYLVLLGRSGGQTAAGGTAASNNLILKSTTHATKGNILFGGVDGLNYNETDTLLSIGGAGQTITVGGTAFKARLTTHMADVTIISGRFGGHSDTAAIAPNILFNRSGGSEATPTIVSDDDRLGIIQFAGYDGADYELAGSIQFDVDGTPGAGDMPGRMVISLSPDGSGTPVEVLRISQDKTVLLPGVLNMSIVTGTAPFTIASTTVVANLNSTQWNGLTNTITSGATGDMTISPAIISADFRARFNGDE